MQKQTSGTATENYLKNTMDIVKNFNAVNAAQNADIDLLSKSIHEVNTQAEDAKAGVLKNNKEIEKIKQQLEQATGQDLTDLTNRLKELEKSNHLLTERIDKLDNEKKEFEEKAEAFIRRTEDRTGKLEAKTNELSNEIQKVKNNAENRLKDEINKLRGEFDQFRTEQIKAQTKQSEEVAKLLKQYEEINNQIIKLSNEILAIVIPKLIITVDGGSSEENTVASILNGTAKFRPIRVSVNLEEQPPAPTPAPASPTVASTTSGSASTPPKAPASASTVKQTNDATFPLAHKGDTNNSGMPSSDAQSASTSTSSVPLVPVATQTNNAGGSNPSPLLASAASASTTASTTAPTSSKSTVATSSQTELGSKLKEELKKAINEYVHDLENYEYDDESQVGDEGDNISVHDLENTEQRVSKKIESNESGLLKAVKETKSNTNDNNEFSSSLNLSNLKGIEAGESKLNVSSKGEENKKHSSTAEFTTITGNKDKNTQEIVEKAKGGAKY